MKLGHAAIIMSIFCILEGTSCRKQPSLPHFNALPVQMSSTIQLPQYNSGGSRIIADSLHCDSLFPILLKCRNQVYLHPQNAGDISNLLRISFDSASGCFFAIGKGVQNNAMPEASWKHGRKMASTYDAKRWALYLKLWSQGQIVPFGKKISGDISYSKVILEKMENDTLFTLVSIPFGSIIIKE